MGERFPWALSSTINTPLGSLSRKPLLSESLSNLNRASLQSSLGSPTEYFGVGPQTERDLSGHLHSKSASLLEVPPRHQSDAMKQNSDLGLHNHRPPSTSATSKFVSGAYWDSSAGEAGATLHRWSSASGLAAQWAPSGPPTLPNGATLGRARETARTQRTISLDHPLHSRSDAMLSPYKYQPRWKADDRVFRHVAGASSTSLTLQHMAYRSALDRPFSRHLDERRGQAPSAVASEHVMQFCRHPRVSTAGPTPPSAAQRLGVRRVGSVMDPGHLPESVLTHLSW